MDTNSYKNSIKSNLVVRFVFHGVESYMFWSVIVWGLRLIDNLTPEQLETQQLRYGVKYSFFACTNWNVVSRLYLIYYITIIVTNKIFSERNISNIIRLSWTSRVHRKSQLSHCCVTFH